MNSTTHYSTLTSPWLNLLNSVTWSIIKTLPHRRWSACKIISSGLCIFRMMITIGYRCQSSSWSWSDSRSSAPCVYLISWPWPRLSRPDLVPSFEKLISIFIRVNTHIHRHTHLRYFVQLSWASSMALNDRRCTRVINMMPINSLIMIWLGQLQRAICKQSCVITLLHPDQV